MNQSNLQSLLEREAGTALRRFKDGLISKDEAIGTLDAYLRISLEASFRSDKTEKLIRTMKQEVYGTRKSGKALAEHALDFVNGSHRYETDQFIATLENGHRTLQQNFTGLVMKWISHLAKQQHYDGRNEASVKLAKQIVKAVPEDQWYLPLV